MSNEAQRAERARAGSNRQRDLRAAGMERHREAVTARLRAEAESRAIWKRQMLQARERFPNAPKEWLPILGTGLARLERKRQPSGNAAVIAWVQGQGYPAPDWEWS